MIGCAKVDDTPATGSLTKLPPVCMHSWNTFCCNWQIARQLEQITWTLQYTNRCLFNQKLINGRSLLDIGLQAQTEVETQMKGDSRCFKSQTW